MSVSEGEMGFVLSSVPMTLAGLCFAVSLSASPFIATIGKALGWPVSIILGYVGAVQWGGDLLPAWAPWARQALMFGPGFFFTWMVIAIVFHEDTIVHELEIGRWLFRRIQAFAKKRLKPASKYKAYASGREDAQ